MIIRMYNTIAICHTWYGIVLNRPQIKAIFHKDMCLQDKNMQENQFHGESR